jgi:hypothetical protein
LKTTQSVEQLRQVNEALIAMGKPPLTKQEAALILGTAPHTLTCFSRGSVPALIAAVVGSRGEEEARDAGPAQGRRRGHQ